MSDDEITLIDDVFGKRYGEVLLVHRGKSGPEATVYNTFPLNDCPDELWQGLETRTPSQRRTTRWPYCSTDRGTG